MVDSNRPQLRLRSVAPISPTFVQPFETPSAQEGIDAVQAQALDNANRSAQTILEGNRGNANILGQMAQDLVGVEQATALTENIQRIQQGSTALPELVGAVQGILGTVEEFRARKREQDRQQALVQFTNEKEELLANSQSILRNPQQGREAYRRQTQALLQKYGGALGYEDIIGFTEELLQPYQEYSSEEALARYGTLQEVQQRQRNITQEQLTTSITQRLVQIDNANTPEDIAGLVSQTQDEVLSLINRTDLSDISKQEVISTAFGQINEVFGNRLGEVGELSATLQRTGEYLSIRTEALQEYYDNGDYEGAAQMDRLLRLQYDIPASINEADPFSNLEQVNRLRGLEQQYRDYNRAAIMEAEESIVWSQAEQRVIAWQLLQDPSILPQLRQTFGENSTLIESAEILADLAQEHYEQTPRDNLRLSALQQELQSNQLRSDQFILSQFSRSDNQDQTLMMLQALSGTGSGLNQVLENYVALKLQGEQLQASGADPEQLRELQERVLSSFSNIDTLIREEANLIQQEIQSRADRLNSLGMGTREQFEATVSGDEVTLESMTERLNQRRIEAQQNLGSTPNFNLPDLAVSQLGSSQAVLPYMASAGNFSISGNVGDARSNGPHAGLDIAMPVGTPLVFYTQGVVVEEAPDPDGYGNYVTIRSPDGHLHRFAHMNDIYVSPGDQVFPGQRIGTSGNTGYGTGPHLHWEIRPPGQSQFGRYDPANSIDPREYTSQFFTAPRQARNNQGGSTASFTENGQEYAPSDKASYGANNNSNNFGYAQLAQDDAYRNGLHRVANNLNIPTQWLADIIAYESEHTSNLWNRGGAPAVGLIQFYADPGTGGRNGTKTIGGRTYRLQDIARMSRVEQLPLVEQYLREARPSDGYQSVYEVLTAIFAGPHRVTMLRENPSSVLGMGDGDITIGNYFRRLGSTAGRQYAPYRPQPIRTR